MPIAFIKYFQYYHIGSIGVVQSKGGFYYSIVIVIKHNIIAFRNAAEQVVRNYGN